MGGPGGEGPEPQVESKTGTFGLDPGLVLKDSNAAAKLVWVGPEIVDFGPLPGPTRRRERLGNAPGRSPAPFALMFSRVDQFQGHSVRFSSHLVTALERRSTTGRFLSTETEPQKRRLFFLSPVIAWCCTESKCKRQRNGDARARHRAAESTVMLGLVTERREQNTQNG